MSSRREGRTNSLEDKLLLLMIMMMELQRYAEDFALQVLGCEGTPRHPFSYLSLSPRQRVLQHRCSNSKMMEGALSNIYLPCW